MKGLRVGRVNDRQRVARERVPAALQILESCRFCAHFCGVNRSAGEMGICRAGTKARWFCAQIESGEEAELSPCFSISLNGCDLRCSFCITGQDSWNPSGGEELDARRMLARTQHALGLGARTIQILGGEPTIHLPSVLELVGSLPGDAHLVYKTNGHCSAEARDLLEGLFDTWVIDYKFGSDCCAERLARVTRYTESVRENLCWAAGTSNLIVRHLLMPGHLECCWRPIAQWLSRELSGVKVSLRPGFWPAWQSHLWSELRGPCAPEEIRNAETMAGELGLHLVPSGIGSARGVQRQTAKGELLILPDGRVLAHNATPELASILRELGVEG